MEKAATKKRKQKRVNYVPLFLASSWNDLSDHQ